MNLNSPLFINNNVTLKNRIVVPPMASGTANSFGTVTGKTLSHYARLATSRASLVMVEYTYVHNSGKSEPNQLGIDSGGQVPGLKQLAEMIHLAGAVSAIQLTHAGAKSSRAQTGGKLISPSGIRVPVKDSELELPDVASSNDIELLKSSFVEAAGRAKMAGFQVVELHSAHGYGLNQWISPITNQRSDNYGGNMLNRYRLILEIIDAIKNESPELALSVRIPGMDHIDGGLNYDETIQLAKLLEHAGVNIINVSSGIGGWRRPRIRKGEGYLVDDAAKISEEVSVPVIGVGGIHSSQYINDSLKERCFSLAAVGRAILNDPTWGKKVGLL